MFVHENNVLVHNYPSLLICNLTMPKKYYTLSLYSRTNVTSAHIPEEDSYYCARNVCVFSRVKKFRD